MKPKPNNSLSMFAEDILKDYGAFIEEHDAHLDKLKTAISPGGNDKLTAATVSLSLVAPPVEMNYGNANFMISEMNAEAAELLANKPLTTLANLCNQCHDLTTALKQYQLAFSFGDFQIDEGGIEQTLHRMSSAIDFYCQVYFVLKRSIVILQNLWNQISASVCLPVDIGEVHLFTTFDSICELLEQIVIFNEISMQSNMSEKWTLYKKWLKNLDKSKANDLTGLYTKLEIGGLYASLDDLETVISGNIFRILLDSLLELKKQFNLKDVNHLTQHSNAYTRKLQLEIESRHQANEYRNYEEPKHIIRLTAFVAILYQLGIQIEGKLMKHLLETLSKYHRLPINQNVHWSPNVFLMQHAKSLIRTPGNKVPTSLQPNAVSLEKIKQNDQRACRQLGTQIAIWSLNMQRVFAAGIFGHLKSFSELILSGQSYADQVAGHIEGLVNRHVALMVPLTKTDFYTICKLMQYLKVIHHTFASNQISFIRFLSSLSQWQKQKVLHLLLTTKKKIVDLKLLQRKMNILSSLKLTEKSLRSHPVRRRLTVINLALSEFLEKDRSLPADKQKLFKSIYQRANNLGDIQRNISGQFDSISLLYNYWLISTSILKEYAQQQRNPYALQNIIAASNHLDKALTVFKCGGNGSTPRNSHDLVIEFLSTHFESFLRVEALSHLFQDQDQPFQQNTLDYRSCTNVSAIEIDGQYNILRDNLENYFTATFYNLTTIAPHDWKSYEKFRHFAYNLLQLRPVDDYLPNQTIDQGIDVLQIMRNIHTFASSYAYNMNLQLFVETDSKGKHLDIIGTRHVANSVQTHGTGIINTTVNFIYQFLRQKFYTFSTFLHDEHIKSRLLKEFRLHAEQKHNNKPYQSYPYERAESFIKKIKRLGFSNNGETYMDLFRKVITQVGNAVGYVRLLQAGSKNANYRSRSYMSRTYSKLLGNECAKNLQLPEATENSIREYGKSVGHMMECYSDCTNYFKLLMQGFQPFFCNPHNHHLKSFFLITPALIMNYIDYRVKEKMKIYKKDQPKCSLFEDGFAIGLVYILNMLNQLSDFHELGWNQTTTQQLNSERQKLRQMLETQKTTEASSSSSSSSASSPNNIQNEKLLQTVAISERHVNAYEQEYNLLYATLSSAEIFFQ
ncbi:WASH complex subunit 4 [Drosophila willistoni]|nr:WASH complex subunit 4 [Drosophila willistoni]